MINSLYLFLLETRDLDKSVLNIDYVTVIIRDTAFMDDTSEISGVLQDNHGMVPDTLAVVDTLLGSSNEGLQSGHIRLVVLAVKSNNDEVTASLAISQGNESLRRVRVSFQQLDSQGELIGRTAVEDTHVDFTVTLGEQVADGSNTVVLFSSTLVGAGNDIGGITVNNITIRSIGFRGQRLGNEATLESSGGDNGQLRDLAALDNTIKAETLEATIC